jgi:hypothetical protein
MLPLFIPFSSLQNEEDKNSIQGRVVLPLILHTYATLLIARAITSSKRFEEINSNIYMSGANTISSKDIVFNNIPQLKWGMGRYRLLIYYIYLKESNMQQPTAQVTAVYKYTRFKRCLMYSVFILLLIFFPG